MAISSSLAIRRDLSARNMERALDYGHELSYGEIPSVVYGAENGAHGNFIPASYRAICAHPAWRKRLEKSYSGGRWIPRPQERSRRELDCANSSDALLMNIFCYPRVNHRAALCALLGIDKGLEPVFGFLPRIPLAGGRTDRTEVDMCIGDLLIEAKLTETGFQTAPLRLLSRYRDAEEVFDLSELTARNGVVFDYQLIRGVLAAYATNCSFMLLCDVRRVDLMEHWAGTVRAVRSYSFRSRLKLLTWQEITPTLPRVLKAFLGEKYGIAPFMPDAIR